MVLASFSSKFSSAIVSTTETFHISSTIPLNNDWISTKLQNSVFLSCFDKALLNFNFIN